MPISLLLSTDFITILLISYVVSTAHICAPPPIPTTLSTSVLPLLFIETCRFPAGRLPPLFVEVATNHGGGHIATQV